MAEHGKGGDGPRGGRAPAMPGDEAGPGNPEAGPGRPVAGIEDPAISDGHPEARDQTATVVPSHRAIVTAARGPRGIVTAVRARPGIVTGSPRPPRDR